MATKIMLIVIGGAILLGSTLAFASGPDHEGRILDSSLMITMTAPALQAAPELEAAPEIDEGLPIPPDEYQAIARPTSYIVAEGLGTLVYADGQLLIVTHDHWSVFDSQLGVVQISNGRGQLLVELQLHQFKSLVRHRDGGTMILSAPEELAGAVQPEQLSTLSGVPNNHQLAPGQAVNLVVRQRNGQSGVATMQVEVESVGQKQGLPVIRLNTLEGLPITGGDSGGGVWLDGQLVANTWTTIMLLDSQSGDMRPTDGSIAALMTNSIPH